MTIMFEFFNELGKPQDSRKLHINVCQSFTGTVGNSPVKRGVTSQGGATPMRAKWIKLDLAGI